MPALRLPIGNLGMSKFKPRTYLGYSGDATDYGIEQEGKR